jgi:hypothetical protein
MCGWPKKITSRVPVRLHIHAGQQSRVHIPIVLGGLIQFVPRFGRAKPLVMVMDVANERQPEISQIRRTDHLLGFGLGRAKSRYDNRHKHGNQANDDQQLNQRKRIPSLQSYNSQMCYLPKLPFVLQAYFRANDRKYWLLSGVLHSKRH